MFFDYGLTIALVIFSVGLIHKIDSWFLANVGSGARDISFSKRFGAGLRGLAGTIFSTRFFKLIKVFFLDVLLQFRILEVRKDPLLWIMHVCIFVGFIYLLIFHAFDKTFAVAVDSSYQPTLNPWKFMRNLFGATVLIGLILAVVRRSVSLRGRLQTNARDIYALGIVTLIIFSGFFLEGLKISSHQEFIYMVQDYGDPSDIEGTAALEAYWVEKFGIVAPNSQRPFAADILAQGLIEHEGNCLQCHSRPTSAFVSFTLSRIISPFAIKLDRDGIRSFIWHIHLLSIFFALAYLPFSKMFHIISTPVSLVVAGVYGNSLSSPAAAANRRVIERDGCKHGGLCHETCPVRINRLERIAKNNRYNAMYDFIDTRSSRDLGSREAHTSQKEFSN